MISGKLLKQLRISNGLTLEEVGNIVGVGKSTVRKWEAGVISSMKSDKLEKLSAALRVDTDYLLGFSLESQLDTLKIEIQELEKELEQCTEAELREDLEDALYIKMESLDDLELAYRFTATKKDNRDTEPREIDTIYDALNQNGKQALCTYGRYLGSQPEYTE